MFGTTIWSKCSVVSLRHKNTRMYRLYQMHSDNMQRVKRKHYDIDFSFQSIVRTLSLKGGFFNCGNGRSGHQGCDGYGCNNEGSLSMWNIAINKTRHIPMEIMRKR